MDLDLWREVQIRSRQDWERGLKGGEVDANTHCPDGLLIATSGAAEGIDTTADCPVYSDGRLAFRTSVMELW